MTSLTNFKGPYRAVPEDEGAVRDADGEPIAIGLSMTGGELARRLNEADEMAKALRTIDAWSDFPKSGCYWHDKTEMSYGAAFGSNGERDYMRTIARAALQAREKVK